MRPLALLLVLASAPAFADRPTGLSSADVTSQLRPYADTIERCYTDRTADVYGAGKMAVELTVSRKGEVQAIAVKTPGLSTKLGVQISNCVVDSLAEVSFPARRTHTTATVPYFFQRTAAVGAGPLRSCFSAAGCR